MWRQPARSGRRPSSAIARSTWCSGSTSRAESLGTLQLVSCGVLRDICHGDPPPYHSHGPFCKPALLCHEEFDQLKRAIPLEAEKRPEPACELNGCRNGGQL